MSVGIYNGKNCTSNFYVVMTYIRPMGNYYGTAVINIGLLFLIQSGFSLNRGQCITESQPLSKHALN